MATSGRPGGQRPRPRHRGRLAPTNGSVTRQDILAIYEEAKRRAVDPPITADEAIHYVVGAIIDWTPGPRERAKMRGKALEREARRRAQRGSPTKGGLVRRP